MQLTPNSLDTDPGPSDWFTGTVYIDTVATLSPPSRTGAAIVHLTPGARTAWHTHPLGQTIYVTEGVGVCQRRGGPIEIIRPGDRVFFEPEDHWHGAAPNRFMTHRHPGGRRHRQPRHLGRARHRRPVQRRTGHQPVTPGSRPPRRQADEAATSQDPTTARVSVPAFGCKTFLGRP